MPHNIPEVLEKIARKLSSPKALIRSIPLRATNTSSCKNGLVSFALISSIIFRFTPERMCQKSPGLLVEVKRSMKKFLVMTSKSSRAL